MARCAHGFELGVVECYAGCGSSSAAASAPKVIEKARAPRVSGRHPGFVDMTGQVCGTWTVLEEGPSVRAGATWRARHVCGAVHVLEGVRLRTEPPKRCPSCRSARRAPKPRRRKKFAAREAVNQIRAEREAGAPSADGRGLLAFETDHLD